MRRNMIQIKVLLMNIQMYFIKLRFEKGFGVWGLGFGVWGLGDRKSDV